jgi:hypothetical protein
VVWLSRWSTTRIDGGSDDYGIVVVVVRLASKDSLVNYLSYVKPKKQESGIDTFIFGLK